AHHLRVDCRGRSPRRARAGPPHRRRRAAGAAHGRPGAEDLFRHGAEGERGMLEVAHLAVEHGHLRARRDVGGRVGDGERGALLGANGAGRSTTPGALIGLYPPAAGSINYQGTPVTGRDTPANVEDGIALVPEGRRLFPDMSVRENLEMGAYVRSRRAAVADALERSY